MASFNAKIRNVPYWESTLHLSGSNPKLFRKIETTDNALEGLSIGLYKVADKPLRGGIRMRMTVTDISKLAECRYDKFSTYLDNGQPRTFCNSILKRRFGRIPLNIYYRWEKP